MIRSLARPLALSSIVVLFVLTLVTTANAAVDKGSDLPDGFSADALHGNYAWGGLGPQWDPATNSWQRARVNLRTGAVHKFALPEGGAFFSASLASDNSMTGVIRSSGVAQGAQLVRYDLGGSVHVLDSTPASPIFGCGPDIQTEAIEKDGTVIALKRAFTDLSRPGYWKCGPDHQNTHLTRYFKDGRSEEVWMPKKYRPWLHEQVIAASGYTLAIGRSATARRAGAVVVLDTKKRKVLAKRRAGRFSRISLSSPDSLYYSEGLSGLRTKLFHWRIGRPDPQVVNRGPGVVWNCGNRVLRLNGETLTLLTAKGKTVLTRRISPREDFSDILCSDGFLLYVSTLDNDLDYDLKPPSTRHVVNLSKLK